MLRPPITTFEGMLDRGIHVFTGFPGHPPNKGDRRRGMTDTVFGCQVNNMRNFSAYHLTKR